MESPAKAPPPPPDVSTGYTLLFIATMYNWKLLANG